MIKIALTKGRIEKNVRKLLEDMGYDIAPILNKDRRLLVEIDNELQIFFVKSVDVVNLINAGVVDIGIVGSDTLFEYPSEKYSQLVDLKSGKCFFALCGFPEYKNIPEGTVKRIATKYPNITKRFFDKKQEQVEIVKLQGSVELGPIIGISDAIVDIVETGDTLRANGLEIIEPVGAVSTRIIGNNERVEEKGEEIETFINRVKECISPVKQAENRAR